MSGPSITSSLTSFDVDGSLQETAARLPTRGQLLRAGARASVWGSLGAALVPGIAGARTSRRQAAIGRRDDEAVLNFALALEYLQAGFYTQAVQVGALRGDLAEQARVVGAHERAHVEALRAQLERAAIARPSFDFHGVTDRPDAFRATAVALEDLAVGAYKQQLPVINSRRYLAAAVAIHSVEARHASWIRRLAGVVPAARAFDEPVADRTTVATVNSTRFVTLHAPRTSAHRPPSFTG